MIHGWHVRPRREKWLVFGVVATALIAIAMLPVPAGRLVLAVGLFLLVGIPSLSILLWGIGSAYRRRF